jgi:glycosyltransferase involved in cell wall biosynthesis
VITVIFSSHNGAETLPAMMESFCALRTDGLPYRIVAVDNASTDATARILQSYRRRLPLACLTEPRRGKNIALNRAVAEIEGDIVVATDDDVLPRPDWLLTFKAAFDAHPEVDVLGGRIEPL